MKRAYLTCVLLAVVLAACTDARAPRQLILLPQSALGRGIYLLADFDSGEGLLWSPDGKTLAGYITEMPMPDFCLGCDVHSEMFILDAATWTRRTILWTDSPTVASLSWLPDSQHLAYDSDPMGRDEPTPIRSIQIDGQNDVPLQDYASTPIWSHDGSKVALQTVAGVPGDWYPQISVLDLQSGRTSTIFTGDRAISYLSRPSWSADDQRLAFSYGMTHAGELPRPTIYEAEIDSGKVTRLLDDDHEYRFAEYAPKGNLIALARNKTAIDEVAVLRDLVSGCEVTLPIEGVWRVSWSPDARKLVISARQSAYIVDLNEFLGPKFAATGSVCP